MPGVFKFFIKGYNTISEMKYILERINSRLNETESNQLFGRQGRKKHPIRARNEKGMLKSEDSLKDLWNNRKYHNTRIIGVAEGERERPCSHYFNLYI